jgi:hypothetical protein
LNKQKYCLTKKRSNLFQHGGTNFTAFRIIDTSKPEVKAVIHDIVSKEISQGRMIEMQVRLGEVR